MTAGFATSMGEYFYIGDPLGLQRAFEQSQADTDVEAEEAARAIG